MCIHTHTLSLSLSQEIQLLRQEIDAQSEVISMMEEAVKENEKRHESCAEQEKQL